MTSLLQAEKQLFDKFWSRTFKAVATPRPESVIIASIAARREANRLETSVCVPAKPSDTKSERQVLDVKETERKRQRKHRAKHKHHSHRRRRRHHSVSLDADFSPRPAVKAKKKKKKSLRKRRRERCHSSSPSPLRKKKKKKKKKKSSKKRKQHRTTSKKRRPSSSSGRRKRKDRKYKKRCHNASQHRHRSRRSNSSDWRSSSTKSGCEDSSKSLFQRSRHVAAAHVGFDWCSSVKLGIKIPSTCTVVHSRPGLEKSGVQDSPCIQGKGRADYDSGNDTSSPLSSKTGVSRAQVTVDTREERKFTDNLSDSGNSLSSYESLSKAERRARHVHTSAFDKLKGKESSSGVGFLSYGSPSAVKCPYRSETRSRSRSRSSASSRRWGRHVSQGRSPSSNRRSYSRSSSYSCDSRRGSVCSLSSRRSGKHSRYTPDRIRERKRSCSSCGKPWKRNRKRSRRRSCSPMRKRRRDSPSHLEARRITSARKRPIPYYRPSPSSSSSRCSSLSTWSLFSLNRNRSRSRSYSRSTSPSSIHSSSRTYDSLASYSRARR